MILEVDIPNPIAAKMEAPFLKRMPIKDMIDPEDPHGDKIPEYDSTKEAVEGYLMQCLRKVVRQGQRLIEKDSRDDVFGE